MEVVSKVIIICASFLAGIIVCALYLVGIPNLVDKSNFPLVSSVTVLGSAFVAVFTATTTLRNHNQRVREKNTIDAISDEKGSMGPEYLYISKFLKVNEGKEQEALIYLARNNTSVEEMQPILSKLNELEHLCEGVFRGIYDFELLKNSRGSTVILVWEKLKPYLLERRVIKREKLSSNPFLSKSQGHEAYFFVEKFYTTLVSEDDKFEKMMYKFSPFILILPFTPAIIAWFKYF
ncbi:DUF4760 domain-containing protein [Shewanella algae]|uniref:DUF4760 domain-containing protein n=1 Tax=Shewanella algae TaxID=38313 RepID=UPI001AAD2BEC|nr:DUF4760 domain-containing protein [Shewanella algae]MBO2556556.1 DUF4760 domain-containing protein [Shewanella algae]MBO2573490.1 DUF4760 domain-containing protein [Shewanella algae]